MRLILILLLAASLRLWNLPNRLPFLADQGRDMLRIYELYSQKRLTLLGPPSSQGHFFFGPLYYYLIAPGLILAKWHPVGASLSVILVDLLGLYFIFRLTRSLTVSLIYATNPLLIHWSQSALNPFFIPGLTAIGLYCWYRKRFFIAGILAGAVAQLHYLAASLIVLTFRRPIFFLGWLVGFSPVLAFEFRHSFFNTKAIWTFLATPGPRYFNLHYLTFLVPLIFLLPWQRWPKILIALIIVLQLARLDLNPRQGYTMPQGWNLSRAYQTAQIIAQDVAKTPPSSFNVAATLDGDSRALPLRYLLQSQFRTIPEGVESYPQAQVLYVLTRWSDTKTLNHGLWEISSFSPQKITQTWPIDADINLYRLEK